MKQNHIIELTDAIMRRCYDHGGMMIAGYTSGRNPRSRSVSSHGAEDNPMLQAIAKMGECALALWLGLDLDALNWGEWSDSGWDVEYRGRLRLDAKTIEMERRYLIWPVNKRYFYDEIKAHVFVLVKHDLPLFQIYGWISKFDFKQIRKEAGHDHKLTEGTWYVDQDDLFKMESLSAYLSLL
jgi:hypothetical protein